jgi:uncharacterized RDD family membrane protein YckC
MMDIEKIEQQLHREQLNLASINKRSFAFFIDEMLISFLFAVIFWDKLASFTTPEQVMNFSRELFVYIMGTKIVYQTIFVYWYGATLGKLAMKIRVVEVEYLGLPTLLQSVFRAVMRVVSEMVFYIGFVIAFMSPVRLTWQDRIATTVVIDV